MISSQLASQFFSKATTWAILCDRYSGQLFRRTCPPELQIEVWSTCVYVRLPATEYRRGISTFISFWDYLDAFLVQSHSKSLRCHAFVEKKGVLEQQFSVTSSQGLEGNSHKVWLNKFGARCSCMLFRCIGNRRREHPYLSSLLNESPYFSGQPICHHILAALDKAGFRDLATYLESHRKRSTA